jgi:hypothetical protein
MSQDKQYLDLAVHTKRWHDDTQLVCLVIVGRKEGVHVDEMRRQNAYAFV